MKKYTIAAMAVLMSASLALAHQAPKTSAAQAKPKTHVVNAEFVKADAAAKTITVKDEKGAEMTAPIEGRAIGELKTFKAGEKIRLTCRDNDKGEHQAIVNIRPAKPTTVAKASKK